MPYKVTDPDLPSNVKKLPAKKKKAWVATWNNIYDSCISDGGDKSTCETKAFKIANGNAKKQELSPDMTNRTILRGIFDGFLSSIGYSDEKDRFDLIDIDSLSPKQRALAIDRIYQQVYQQLRELDEWSYPMSLYIENGSVFCTVAQSGKIFKVPLNISNDSVEMGSWVRVEETFTPVVEQSFRIRKMPDGKYRWTAIAGTTVLNRVGEIDSSELFDSFIEHAERTGDYPRLDFYHLGIENPEMWEFGTADYLAREGVCYIASGLFDESHPLAKATIQSCEKGNLEWGNSVEFYATVKEELVASTPEIKVPVYKRGRNSRISLVLEEDAAGLFTQYVISQEVKRTMDQKTREKLTALYGGDDAGLEAFLKQFETQVDGVNRTVKDNNLVHRSTDAADTSTDSEADADAEAEAEDDDDSDIVIDDETMQEIATQVVQSNDFQTLVKGVAALQKMVGELIVEREKEKAEITRLNKVVGDLGKEDTEKKQEYLQDLPRNKRTVITHRPREMNDALNGDKSMDNIANRTLNGIPAASRY